jgi:hypothetical protein
MKTRKCFFKANECDFWLILTCKDIFDFYDEIISLECELNCELIKVVVV